MTPPSAGLKAYMGVPHTDARAWLEEFGYRPAGNYEAALAAAIAERGPARLAREMRTLAQIRRAARDVGHVLDIVYGRNA